MPPVPRQYVPDIFRQHLWCFPRAACPLEDDSGRPVGWTLFRELKGYLTLELECSGYDDHGVFKLEHKLKAILSECTNGPPYNSFTSKIKWQLFR